MVVNVPKWRPTNKDIIFESLQNDTNLGDPFLTKSPSSEHIQEEFLVHHVKSFCKVYLEDVTN